jgi:hypothetical protein
MPWGPSCLRIIRKARSVSSARKSSRKCTPSESNYSAVEGECYSACWGMRYFRWALHGTPFVLKSDCQALVWLHKHKDLSSRLTRWALRLQDFQYVIEYRKNKEHCNVDALTRMPFEPAPERAPNSIHHDPDINDLMWALYMILGWMTKCLGTQALVMSIP